ncbi:MAG: 2-oxoglutarate dehydrogenase E1 component, partial [Candidatus Caldatribacteriota bacterium]
MSLPNDYSYVQASDNTFIDGLYNDYKRDPSSVDTSWQQFFKGVEFALARPEGAEGEVVTNLGKEFKVYNLIEAYRDRGHLVSTTNPIRPRMDRKPQLDITHHGLTNADLEETFVICEVIGLKNAKLKDIVAHLQKLYAGNIGVEYAHMNDLEAKEWFKNKYESTVVSRNFDLNKKKRILTKLNEAVAFENFLHTKYVGQKRFSLEGGENTIPALDALINKSSELGVEEVVIGMAHRGRLNVLANIMGKTYEYIFNEFEGQATPDLT